MDAGALIAYERRSSSLLALLRRADTGQLPLAVPAGVLAQVWRSGGARQARLSRLLRGNRMEVVPLDAAIARGAGRLLSIRGGSDVIDASVVICALERGHAVVTSDAGDIVRLAPHVRVIVV